MKNLLWLIAALSTLACGSTENDPPDQNGSGIGSSTGQATGSATGSATGAATGSPTGTATGSPTGTATGANGAAATDPSLVLHAPDDAGPSLDPTAECGSVSGWEEASVNGYCDTDPCEAAECCGVFAGWPWCVQPGGPYPTLGAAGACNPECAAGEFCYEVGESAVCGPLPQSSNDTEFD